MPTRRQFLAVSSASAAALAGCGDGVDAGQTESPTDATDGDEAAGEDGSGDGDDTESDGQTEDATGDESSDSSLAFSSPAFDDGGTIPEKYTGVGEDVSPPLTIESVPEEAETLALVLDDPDANNYVHWLLWNVPAETETIPEGIPQEETVSELDGARQGENNFGELGYRGPLPPADDDAHTYRFTLSAVNTSLDLAAGSGRGKLEDALDGNVIKTATITGEFNRN